MYVTKMTIYDNIAELVTLIDSEWDSANTSNKKPNIGKITDYPFNMDYNDDKGYLVIYSILETESTPGLGELTTADISETVKTDLRVNEDETYFLECKAELKRILYSNHSNPTTNICMLDLSSKNITNLSNRMKRFYREVRELTLESYSRNMI